MYSRPQDPLWKSALLLIRSVKSNKALLLTEVTRPTVGRQISHNRKEVKIGGENNIVR